MADTRIPSATPSGVPTQPSPEPTPARAEARAETTPKPLGVHKDHPQTLAAAAAKGAALSHDSQGAFHTQAASVAHPPLDGGQVSHPPLPDRAAELFGTLTSKPGSPEASRQVLAGLAMSAVSQTLAQHANTPGQTGPTGHPLLEKFGQALGLGLGVIVTEALAAIPSWNTPVLDAQGRPATHVDGADRIGSHDLLKRHQEVVGPKINALVQTLQPGVVRDLLEGLGQGATEAPGASYRLESSISDLFKHP